MSRLVRTPGLESLVDIVPLEPVLWSLRSCCGVRLSWGGCLDTLDDLLPLGNGIDHLIVPVRPRICG